MKRSNSNSQPDRKRKRKKERERGREGGRERETETETEREREEEEKVLCISGMTVKANRYRDTNAHGDDNHKAPDSCFPVFFSVTIPKSQPRRQAPLFRLKHQVCGTINFSIIAVLCSQKKKRGALSIVSHESRIFDSTWISIKTDIVCRYMQSEIWVRFKARKIQTHPLKILI